MDSDRDLTTEDGGIFNDRDVGRGKRKPERPRWVPRAVFIASFLTLFAIWGNFYVFGIVFLPFLCEFGAGRAVTSGVSSTLLLLIAMFAPVTTVISKRWGASTAMVAGALLCSVANILASFAENIGVLYITYGVMLGAGSSLSYTAVLCELPAYFAPGQRSRAIAMVETGAVLGLIGMAPLMDFCVKAIGWRRALWVFGVLMAILLLPAPFAFHPHYKYVSDGDDEDKKKKYEDSGNSIEMTSVNSVANPPSLGKRAHSGSALSSEGRIRSSTATSNGISGHHLSPASSFLRRELRSTGTGSLEALAGSTCDLTLDAQSSASLAISDDVDGASLGEGDVLLAAGEHYGSELDLSRDASSHQRRDSGSLCGSIDADPANGPTSDEDALLDSSSKDAGTETKQELSGFRPYLTVWRNNKFKLFCLASCLWYFSFTAPLVYLVDMSELAAKKASNGSETAETCESSFTDGLLYIYMALALLVCFPIAGHVFDKLMVAYKQCIVLIILYVVTGFLVVVIPLASTQWQFNLVAVGIGVSRTPDVLHPAFLLSILGEDLYPYAWALLLCLSAIVDGAAPPIVGAIHDAVGEFFTPYLMISVIVGFATVVLVVLLMKLSPEPKAWLRRMAARCCCRWRRGQVDLYRHV